MNPTGCKTNCPAVARVVDQTLAGNFQDPLAGQPLTAPASAPEVAGPSYFGANQFTNVYKSGNWENDRLDVELQMLELGHGARGIVVGSRGTDNIGHVLNVVNFDNRVYFIDAQYRGSRRRHEIQ